jgi:hypothetical protein
MLAAPIDKGLVVQAGVKTITRYLVHGVALKTGKSLN